MSIVCYSFTEKQIVENHVEQRTRPSRKYRRGCHLDALLTVFFVTISEIYSEKESFQA